MILHGGKLNDGTPWGLTFEDKLFTKILGIK
jgi:hypothetical protein